MGRKYAFTTVLVLCICAVIYLYVKYPDISIKRHPDGRDRMGNVLSDLEHSPDPTSQQHGSCIITVPIPGCNCTRQLIIPEAEICNTDPSQHLHKIIQSYGSSTCSDLATLRGTNQSVFTLGLGGIFPSDYFKGAKILVESVKSSYPGWIMRIYHNLDMSKAEQNDYICDILCNNPHVDACPVSNLTELDGISESTNICTVWRFSVVGDPLVARYVIRDSDSPILQREVAAVKEWINSEKCYHVMRDHRAHKLAIMGGMWGGCNWWQQKEAAAIRSILLKTKNLRDDQNAIKTHLWPLMSKNLISHASFHCERFNDSAQPFPTQRVNFTFIGQRTFRSNFEGERLMHTCPKECRPKNHQDWDHC